MIPEVPTTLEPMPDGSRTVLMGSMADIDLAGAGYVQSEWRCSGTAEAYRPSGPLGADGRWSLEAADRAAFATRLVVRMPSDPSRSSGTVVVEWLNVSSGADACPFFGFAGPEIVRAGHTWVGVSAQWAGVVSAPALVDVGGAAPAGAPGCRSRPLPRPPPPRRRVLLRHLHPGGLGGRRVRSAPGGPLDGRTVDGVVAVGESQSAYALTTYANGVHLRAGVFDGFLVHSRGGPPLPLGDRDRGVDLEAGRDDLAVRIRDDLDVPVLVLQTETDVLGHLYSLPGPTTRRRPAAPVGGGRVGPRRSVADRRARGSARLRRPGEPGPAALRGPQCPAPPGRVDRRRPGPAGGRAVGGRGRPRTRTSRHVVRHRRPRHRHRRCPHAVRRRPGRGADRPRCTRRQPRVPAVRPHPADPAR